jgi:Zn-dependent protease with chaperone function
MPSRKAELVLMFGVPVGLHYSWLVIAWLVTLSLTGQFGIGTAFLRFSREYEKQADLLGSHVMARAGYDPREMAAMFRMLEKEGGTGAPAWLSDHPNPGNPAEYIDAEARSLIDVAPANQYVTFEPVFRRVTGSIRLTER